MEHGLNGPYAFADDRPVAGKPNGESDGVHDELADLFMGEEPIENRQSEAVIEEPKVIEPPVIETKRLTLRAVESADVEAEHEPASSAAVKAEALLLSSLPAGGATGSMWARQYAGWLALDRKGAVALVGLSAKGLSLDLIGSVDGSIGRARDLFEAMRLAKGVACGLVVHADDLTASALLGCDWIERATVLSGADRGSTVSAYRVLKTASEQFDAAHGEGSGPELSLAIAGAETSVGRETLTHLGGVSRRFLGRALVEGPVLSRVQPMRTTEVWRTDESVGVDDLGEAWLSAGDAETEDQPIGRIASSEPEEPGILRAMDGLRLIDLRCPVVNGVTLAINKNRRLAIIAEVADGSTERLLVAKAWAETNRELIAMATPGGADASNPTLHAVSERFSDLRPMLDSGIKLHLAVKRGRTLIVTELV